jgi:ubiquitin carboxyl-terminal hydrolase 4/11/15
VAAAAAAAARPATLDQCLGLFSREEALSEPGFCAACSKSPGAAGGEPAVTLRAKTKRIEIWRAPPLLLVQLKRFVAVGAAVRKVSTLVDFPVVGLDLGPHMARDAAPHPPPDLWAWAWLGGRLAAAPEAAPEAAPVARAEDGAGGAPPAPAPALAPAPVPPARGRSASVGDREAHFAGLPCLLTRSRAVYDLYAVVDHTGGMGAGHYTAYARSPFDDRWHHFNDRAVSDAGDTLAELRAELVSPAAYLLCYARRDIADGWAAALAAEDAALGRAVAPDAVAAARRAQADADAAAAAAGGTSSAAAAPPAAPLETWDVFPHAAGAAPAAEVASLRSAMLATSVASEPLGAIDALVDSAAKCGVA